MARIRRPIQVGLALVVLLIANPSVSRADGKSEIFVLNRGGKVWYRVFAPFFPKIIACRRFFGVGDQI